MNRTITTRAFTIITGTIVGTIPDRGKDPGAISPATITRKRSDTGGEGSGKEWAETGIDIKEYASVCRLD